MRGAYGGPVRRERRGREERAQSELCPFRELQEVVVAEHVLHFKIGSDSTTREYWSTYRYINLGQLALGVRQEVFQLLFRAFEIGLRLPLSLRDRVGSLYGVSGGCFGWRARTAAWASRPTGTVCS